MWRILVSFEPENRHHRHSTSSCVADDQIGTWLHLRLLIQTWFDCCVRLKTTQNTDWNIPKFTSIRDQSSTRHFPEPIRIEHFTPCFCPPDTVCMTWTPLDILFFREFIKLCPLSVWRSSLYQVMVGCIKRGQSVSRRIREGRESNERGKSWKCVSWSSWCDVWWKFSKSHDIVKQSGTSRDITFQKTEHSASRRWILGLMTIILNYLHVPSSLLTWSSSRDAELIQGENILHTSFYEQKTKRHTKECEKEWGGEWEGCTFWFNTSEFVFIMIVIMLCCNEVRAGQILTSSSDYSVFTWWWMSS